MALEALGVWEGFGFGVLGGFLGEFVGWFKLREILHRSWPDFVKSKVYWTLTFIMVLVGGGLVVLYMKSGLTFNEYLAVNVGVAAPLILERLGREIPFNPGRVD